MQQKGIDLLLGWEVAYFIPPLQSVCIKVIYRQPPNFLKETLAYVITRQTSPSHLIRLKKWGKKSETMKVFFVLFFNGNICCKKPGDTFPFSDVLVPLWVKYFLFEC